MSDADIIADLVDKTTTQSGLLNSCCRVIIRQSEEIAKLQREVFALAMTLLAAVVVFAIVVTR